MERSPEVEIGDKGKAMTERKLRMRYAGGVVKHLALHMYSGAVRDAVGAKFRDPGQRRWHFRRYTGANLHA